MTDNLICPNCEETVEKPKTEPVQNSFPCPKCAFQITLIGEGGKSDGTITKLLKIAGEESQKTLLPTVKWLMYCGIALFAGVFFIALYLFTKYPPFPNRLEQMFVGDVVSYHNWTKGFFG